MLIVVSFEAPARHRILAIIYDYRIMDHFCRIIFCIDITLKFPADKLFQRCDRLSGGQLQRVGIARVLYQQPELILADEPVSALDPALARATIGLLVDEARSRGATLVASLHAVDLALEHFPRIVGVRAGRIAFDRPAAEVTPQMLDALYAGAEKTSTTVIENRFEMRRNLCHFD